MTTSAPSRWWRTRRGRALAGTVVVAAIATGAPTATGAEAPSAPSGQLPQGWVETELATAPLSVATVHDIAVEPMTGRVFVSGGTAVEVLEADGSPVAVLPGFTDARGLVEDQGSVHVIDAGTDVVTELGGATLAEVAERPAGRALTGYGAMDGSTLWLTAPGVGQTDLLGIDTGTGTTTTWSSGATFDRLATGVGEPGVLLAWSPGSPTLRSIEAAGTPSVVATVTEGSAIADVDVVGDEAWIASGARKRRGLPNLGFLGVESLTTASAVDGRASMGAYAGEPAGWVAPAGSERATHLYFPPTPLLPALLATAPDGSLAYAVTAKPADQPPRLVLLATQPRIEAIDRTSDVAHVPSTATITGHGVAATTGATVGGIGVGWSVTSARQVVLDVPTSLGPGDHAVQLTTPFGTASAQITLDANVGATLSGTVRNAGSPVAGAEVVLSGGDLDAPMAVTASGAGAYVFGGVPYGTDYRLEVTDPTGTGDDQVVTPLVLVPNLTSVVDVDLRSTTTSADDGSTTIDLAGVPSTTAIAVHGEGEHVFLAVTDRIVVLDAQLRWTTTLLLDADRLAVVDDTLVLLDGTGRTLVTVDIGTWTVTGHTELPEPIVGPITGLAGRVWFRDGSALASWAPGAPATATHPSTGPVDQWTVVQGAPDELLTWDSGGPITRWDLAGPAPVALATLPVVARPALASATYDRLWTTDGIERVLADGTPTGGSLPWTTTSGIVDVAGGLLATWTDAAGLALRRLGDRRVTHDLAASEPWGVVPQPDAVVVLGTDRRHRRVPIAPAVSSLEPASVVAGVPTTVEMRGAGVGVVTGVEVDGVPALFAEVAPDRISVDVPPLDGPPGPRPVAVTTPTGTAVAELTVIANQGATLRGDVDGTWTAPTSGVQLELLDGGGSIVDETTPEADGTYAFTGVPLGDDYRLRVTDDEGAYVGQDIWPLALTPNDETTLDVDLSPTTPASPTSAYHQVRVGGPVADVVHHAMSDRTVASAIAPGTGPELAVLDAEGRLVARRLAVGGSTLAVDGATIVSTEGGDVRWTDVTTLDDSAVATLPNGRTASHPAVVDGVVWVIGRPPPGSGLGPALCRVEPTPSPATCHETTPGLANLGTVAGAPERLAVVRGGAVEVYDTTGAGPVLTGSVATPEEWADDLASSAALGRLWLSTGQVVALPSLAPLDPLPTVGGSVAASEVGGGIVVVDGQVLDASTLQVLAQLDVTSRPGALATDGTGRVFAGTDTGIVSVHDLAPHASSVRPTWLRPTGGSVSIAGPGVRWVDAVELDGTPVDHQVAADGTLVATAGLEQLTGPTPRPASLVLHSRFGSTTVPLTVGYAPPGPVIDAGLHDWGALVATWAPPIDEGSSPVTHYEVTVGPTTLVVPASDLGVPFYDLSEGTYTATIRAVSADGVGDPVETSSVVLGPQPPTRPVEVVAAAPSTGGVVLRWQRPTNQGTSPIDHYEVQDMTAGRSATVPAPTRSLTVPDLVGSTTVSLRVRAVSSVGAGPWEVAAPVVAAEVAPPFPDVPTDHPLFWELWSGRELGVATGYPDGSFRPGSIVSRQAAVAFLWRMAGEPAAGDGGAPLPDPGFSDVGADHPFRNAIWWAASEGIVDGYPDGTFRGGASVTRQAWMAFQWRAAGQPPVPGGCTASFIDVGPTHPFRTPILWAACDDITTGYPEGTFRPAATVTRQAAIAFLMRPTWPQWEPILAP